MASCHEWFEAGDGDEGSGSSDSGTDVCDQLYESMSRVSIYFVFFVSHSFFINSFSLFFFFFFTNSFSFFLDIRIWSYYQGCLRRDPRAVRAS